MSARDVLAKLIFVADNAAAPEPEHEWEMTTRHNPAYAAYAFTLADAILAAGYRDAEAAKALHRSKALPCTLPKDQTCAHCGHPWPCPTTQALEGGS